MKKIIGILLVLLLPVLVLTAVVSAQTFRSGTSPVVAAGETIDGSAFLAGSSVDVAGKINGDLYCAGQTITISGEVAGDVICAGQTISLTGTVAGDIRIAGQTITAGGKVNQSATLMGQTVTLDGQSSISQDAVLAGQTINVNGPVARDLTIAATTATLGSRVGRNVSASLDRLTLAQQAEISGSVDYTSPQQLTMNSGARVVGDIHYTHMEREIETAAAIKFSWFGMIVGMLMLITSALFFTLLFPRLLHDTTKTSVASPSRALLAVLIGFVAGIVVPVAFIFLMITVLGIPFAFVVLLGWLLILATSGAFSAYYLGRVIWRGQPNAILTMLIGAVILAVLLAIPILNVIVWFFAVWYGSGVILLQLKESWPAPHYTMSLRK